MSALITRSTPHKLSTFMLTITLLALLLVSCGSASPASQSTDQYAPSGAPVPAERQSTESEAPAEPSFVADYSVQAEKRIVIKNASLSIVVPDPAKSMDRIGELAEEMSGFVVTASLYQSRLDNGREVPRASITVRVPAERLNEAIEGILAETDRPVIRQDINSQDVTSEYTDLQSRLRNLENTENQLAEIMEEARRTEDVLSVYNELVRVREQIEVIKGQIQYYDQSAALSAISVDLQVNEAVQPLTIGSWQPVGVAKDAVQSLINAMQFLVTAAIWMAIFILPVGLVLYVVFYLPLAWLLRAMRQRRANQKVAAIPPTPPAPAG